MAFPKFHFVPDLGTCFFSAVLFHNLGVISASSESHYHVIPELSSFFSISSKRWKSGLGTGSKTYLTLILLTLTPKPAKLLLHLPIPIFSGNSPPLVAGVLTLCLHSDCWYIPLSISTHLQNLWSAFLEVQCRRQSNRETT